MSLYNIKMRNQQQQQLANIQFFAKAGEEIRKIRQQSIQAQTVSRRIKKIAAMKKQTPKLKHTVPQNLIKNIIIDFLRAKNLNYTYSVFMRECDLLSSDVILRSELVSFLQLQQYYDNAPLNATIVELLLEKITLLQSNKKKTKDFGLQIELVKQDNTLDSVVLNQIQIAAIRRQVQDGEKKHYESLLASMKKSLTGSLKEQIKKQYETKMKEMKVEYERQVGILKEKNKEFLIGNPKINPKIQQYLKKIEQLQSKNMNLTLNLKEMQKQKISHNCFKVPKIVQKQAELDVLKRDLQKKKQEYQFALKTLHTSTQSIASKKSKATEVPKQTDLFLAELKNKKDTKDYMIDEMHGRMLVMDKRIDALSKDNQTLRQVNRQLTSKVAQVQEFNTKLKQNVEQNSKAEEKAKMFDIKPKSKSIGINVTPEDFKERKKQNVIDEMNESSSSESDIQQQINRKTKYRFKIHEMDAQMQTQKNKLKLFLDDFI